jgi:lysophospholipase L1-like esterase
MNVPTPGETPLYGVLKQLRSLPGKRIGSAPGVGGASIVDLSKGTEPYGRLLANVRNAMSQSESPYTVPAIIWLQGEADEYTGVPYASLLNKLANDLDVDIRAITKQKTPVQIHICLVQASAASQQQLVASQHPNVHIACENKDYEKSDGTHFSAKGSRDAGMALGASIAKMWQARL